MGVLEVFEVSKIKPRYSNMDIVGSVYGGDIDIEELETYYRRTSMTIYLVVCLWKGLFIVTKSVTAIGGFEWTLF